jgi:hypothetical protein
VYPALLASFKLTPAQLGRLRDEFGAFMDLLVHNCDKQVRHMPYVNRYSRNRLSNDSGIGMSNDERITVTPRAAAAYSVEAGSAADPANAMDQLGQRVLAALPQDGQELSAMLDIDSGRPAAESNMPWPPNFDLNTSSSWQPAGHDHSGFDPGPATQQGLDPGAARGGDPSLQQEGNARPSEDVSWEEFLDSNQVAREFI